MRNYRIISSFLLICIVLALLPVSAQAEERHFHPRVSFDTAITQSQQLSSEGSAYLVSDVIAQSDILINGSLSLCLNGFKLDLGAHSIIIGAEGSLTIYDCSMTGSGGITAQDGEKAAIMVGGTLEIQGGSHIVQGRSFIMNKAFTSISGGTISGSDVQLVQTIGSAMLNIIGGEIRASGKGSAVCMIADPLDDSGKKKDFNAGIAGGLITAQSGSPGAVVVNAPKGRFVLNTGANIRGSGCPGVTVQSGSFDAYGGAVVYSDSESAILGTGGKVNLYFATVTSEEKYGVDIIENAELLLSGSLDIVGGQAGVHLAEGKVFSMSDYGFYGDVRVSILTDTTPAEGERIPISTKCDPKHYPHFLSSNPHCGISYDPATMVIYNTYDGSVSHSHGGRNYVHVLSSGYSDVNKNNYYLESDLSCQGFFVGSVVNICLNGHKLKLSSALKLYPNSTLNIFDCQGGGVIECGSWCVQDINNGSARLILHEGTVLSHGSCAVKLSGNDSVVVKGGEIKSELEGSCAIEVSGSANSIDITGGSVTGAAAGVRVLDSLPDPNASASVQELPLLYLSGDGELSGADYALHMSGLKAGFAELGGSLVYTGSKADIQLAPGKLISTSDDFSPEQKILICSDNGFSAPLGSVHSPAHFSYFESNDSSYIIGCVDNNILEYVRTMRISPENAEIQYGESAGFSVDCPDSSKVRYQWHMRKSGESVFIPLSGASTAVYTCAEDLSAGEYEFYCTAITENTKYISGSAILNVKGDSIENLSISQSGQLCYNGEAQPVSIEATASTAMGREVTFSYSLDGNTYSSEMPLIGPDVGEYTVYYKATADSCEPVEGELSVSIKSAKLVSQQKETGNMENYPRFLAILVSVGILFILCIVYFIRRIKSSGIDD